MISDSHGTNPIDPSGGKSNIDPVTGALVIEGTAAAVNAVTKGGPRRQYKWNKRAAEDANTMNRENQKWLLEQNKALQAEQREYDNPKSQMARYLAAGLNPNMIYGSGSPAGNAFPIDSGGVPGVNIQPPSAQYPDIAGTFLQAGQTLANTGLTQSRTINQDLRNIGQKMTNEIMLNNPSLDPAVMDSVRQMVESTARLKTQENTAWLNAGGKGQQSSKKVEMEIEEMSQKLGLNTTDLNIRNQILESKKFENAIKEIQVKWLKDGSLTPEHLRQGFMLILSKMLP